MAKQRMVVTDNQLLIDMDLFFNAVRDSSGNWERVETELHAYQDGVVKMSRGDSSPSLDAPKERMMVTDDQLIIDVDLLFSAIRELDGNWQQVENDMRAYLEMVRKMAG